MKRRDFWDKHSELGRISEQTKRSSKDLSVKTNSKPIKEVTEKNLHYSEEKVKPSEKRSSKSWKSLAVQVTNSERMKRTSGSVKHKNGIGHESEGRSHSHSKSKEKGAEYAQEGRKNMGFYLCDHVSQFISPLATF